MTRSVALAALAALTFAFAQSARVRAEEPKKTDTVDIYSSVAEVEKEKAMPGVGVIYGQKEWERLAAAWGIKDPPKVDFTKEILLVGTWRGANFKFLSDVKDGDLTVELVGDKEEKAGFRYRVVSLSRQGLTKFQGKDLAPTDTSSVTDPKAEKPAVSLSGDIKDEVLLKEAPTSGVIVSQKQWDALVKAWGIKDAPKVDFTRDVLAVGTWRGSSFDLAPVVRDGDLTLGAKGTKDLAPGFRWKVVSVRREGIKTVQGQALPKE